MSRGTTVTSSSRHGGSIVPLKPNGRSHPTSTLPPSDSASTVTITVQTIPNTNISQIQPTIDELIDIETQSHNIKVASLRQQYAEGTGISMASPISKFKSMMYSQ